jgi:hypothetical protein
MNQQITMNTDSNKAFHLEIIKATFRPSYKSYAVKEGERPSLTTFHHNLSCDQWSFNSLTYIVADKSASSTVTMFTYTTLQKTE